MGEVTFPAAIPFDGCDGAATKELALKVLEEAAELVEAVKRYAWLMGTGAGDLGGHGEREMALDEAMDVYQALANLLAGEFSDEEIAYAYARCVGRNRERGRL